jgi:hypothetical protein
MGGRIVWIRRACRERATAHYDHSQDSSHGHTVSSHSQFPHDQHAATRHYLIPGLPLPRALLGSSRDHRPVSLT